MLVSIRNIVTAEHVQLARLTGRLGEIAGLLSDAGGKKVSNAIDKMQMGRDRLAVILEGADSSLRQFKHNWIVISSSLVSTVKMKSTA
jgi:hypothetical protein